MGIGRKGHPSSTAKRREAFLDHLRSVGPGPECITWPWTRQITKYAYTSDENGKSVAVHRYVHERLIGPIPPGYDCLHTCDNPPCCRPSHLWAGTHSDNMKDAYQKGRKKSQLTGARPGEAHHNARLTAADVYAIRRLCKQGVSQSVIALTYGVTRPNVSSIHRRHIWKHLPEETI